MARILIILVCLLGPLAIYLLWIRLVWRKQELAAAGRLERWRALPWTWLIVAGVLLLAVTLIGMNLLGIDPDGWIGGESLVKRQGQS